MDVKVSAPVWTHYYNRKSPFLNMIVRRSIPQTVAADLHTQTTLLTFTPSHWIHI